MYAISTFGKNGENVTCDREHTYLSFEDPAQAQELASLLDIPLYDNDEPLVNELSVKEYVDASRALLLALPTIAAALKMNAALVERAARTGETPAVWSFHERDMARAAGAEALAVLRPLQHLVDLPLADWTNHNPTEGKL